MERLYIQEAIAFDDHFRQYDQFTICLEEARVRAVRSGERCRESLLDQHRDSINECLCLHRPGADLVDTKID